MSSIERCPRCGATWPVVQWGNCGGCGNSAPAMTKADTDAIERALKLSREANPHLGDEAEVYGLNVGELADLRTRVVVLTEALERIKARATELRAGTDDWFELVEFEQVASQALSSSDSREK
jgi:hypothetical protein